MDAESIRYIQSPKGQAKDEVIGEKRKEEFLNDENECLNCIVYKMEKKEKTIGQERVRRAKEEKPQRKVLKSI